MATAISKMVWNGGVQPLATDSHPYLNIFQKSLNHYKTLSEDLGTTYQASENEYQKLQQCRKYSLNSIIQVSNLYICCKTQVLCNIYTATYFQDLA
ncbi:hypothetical protein E2C01_084157 [Portunus trituberculatus]|uniref:Uncharacterized protein n=1 Tax=Portunus trituberculatus TaxID=210409 RepID=A0A5B7IUJ7_PORTR|nr:hypothetical protein [Portunus trituberculatus]